MSQKRNNPISLSSAPDGATFTIVDRNGKEVAAGQTPTTVILKSGNGFFKKAVYSINFSKPGFSNKTLTLEADVNGWYFGNLVFGGLIGLLIVDPATGAMYKFNQKDVQAMLSQTTVFAPLQEGALRIVSIDEVPQELRAKMVEVK
ncbi:hypothetical protein ACD591_06280 [Rufibacter glacialis]|uniref:PEGA domain-containing protein n=1 Tax=Rufibacter glacialis TaxID=1259555 RepID=A0A5M8QET6_9BACT|nr:hypothetical protein [Rufibacter glacialis]KAA6433266.1 hypothetical protein FOE74_12330 [Rufibacter glacialis]GGK76001.1 hypothetical protein GCM10011405_24750 [Rufibacter glacialis]